MAVCSVDCLARAPLNSFGRTNKWGVRCCAGEVRQVLNTDLAEFSIPDSAIAVGRADGRPRPFDCPAAAYAADATADAAPLDVAQLTAQGDQVPCGGEMGAMMRVAQNVLRVRDLSAVRVEWKGLEAALRSAGRQLMPGVGLRAELCSVLVYRRGGFFWPHRASTKGPQHVGTLEVLLGPVTKEGGELVPYSQGRGIASWRPTAAGDWAMWFQTKRHEVLPVTAGPRMVACYNIFVDADAVGFSAVVPPPFARRIRRRRRGVTRYSAKRCTLSGVPVEVLQRIAQFLGAGSVKQLSVSCRRLHMAVGDPVTLLTAYFQERRAKIIGCCRAAGMTHVLLPLFHDYPLDGGEETLLCLRGRDRVMYAAAQAVFGEGVTMEPCAYIGTGARVQYEVRGDGIEDPEVAEEFVGGYPQRGTCPVGVAQDIGKYVRQLDDFIQGMDVHEFVSAVPLFTPRKDMLRNRTNYRKDLRVKDPESAYKLAGVVPYMDVFMYRSCLLAVPV
jgi:hypothetical protein